MLLLVILLLTYDYTLDRARSTDGDSGLLVCILLVLGTHQGR